MKRAPANRNRFTDARLWDDTGREWSRSSSGLSKADVEAVLGNPAIRVGVHEDFGQPLWWVEADRRRSVWIDQIAPRFADDTRPLARLPRGRRPYSASRWTSNGDQLLVFESD